MASSQPASLVGMAGSHANWNRGRGEGVRTIWWFVKIRTPAPHSSKMFLNEKALPLRQKEELIFLQRSKKPRTKEHRIAFLIYHYEPLMNENIIHIFLWFYAWLWSISRGGNERDKHRGQHCCFDVTNNCIYDGIIQFIYFPLILPIKRWHFPSICSLLMFYVLLSSRVCGLLSKRANFSQH